MKSLLLVLMCWLATVAATAAEKPNVLFIAVDDLNHWVGYTGRNPQAQTPNIDRLSKRGVSFTRAYCAAPLCNPSRAALMSGLRPSTSAVYDNNDNWKSFIPAGKSLTVPFQQAGYFVAGAGKIFHSDSYYPSEWDDYFDKAHGHKTANEHGAGVGKDEGFLEPVQHELKDEDINDWHITQYCINQLGKSHDKPFFLACGLHKPHLPWVVPKQYYNQFPIEKIQLPPFQPDDLADIPPAGVRMAKPQGDHAAIVSKDRWKLAIQSYLACCAYTDMNLGRLLDALDKSRYRDNTIIVFWGDHGWHLGEKSHWRKFSLWEEATRAPLIWVVPGVTQSGTTCERTVDFMSIYPTLCDVAGVATPAHVEGRSMRSLLANPNATWSEPALTTFGFQNHSVRDARWRYIRYADGSEELYDHSQDEFEWQNIATQAEHTAIKLKLAESFPKTNAPAKSSDASKPKNKKSKDQ